MNKEFFNIAFMEAKKAFDLDEVPIGAVIVKNGTVISSGFNMKESNNCSLDHAELIAIKEASSKLNNWRLDDCDIYVSLDPCPMCASAIKQARIQNVYSALNNKDFANKDILKMIFQSDLTNPGVSFQSNLDTERFKKILNSFFEKQRNS